MHYKSFSDLTRCIAKNINKIPKDIDLIVGVPRSGLLVANVISLLLNKPMTDIQGLFCDRLIANGVTKHNGAFIKSVKDCKKILVVEDSICSGESITKWTEEIKKQNFGNAEFVFLAVYAVPEKAELADICFEKVALPRIFEWNIFHHTVILKKTCCTLEGVLCKNPLKTQTNGERYLRYIKTAKPKIIPSCEIGYIITARAEKYREETEKWLLNNGVKYANLIMWDNLAESETDFKARIYKVTDNAMMFIEGDVKKAKMIFSTTQKPVYCVKNNKMYDAE